MRRVRIMVAAIFGITPTAAVVAAGTRPIEVRSPDGTRIVGQADVPAAGARTTVIFVPGTGAFDRDGRFGKSGTPADLVFKDLAARMNARGLATVRFDLRGVRHGVAAADARDLRVLAGRTTTTMRDDLRAIHDWTRSSRGLGAHCVIFFTHSEGMLHVARLAEGGAPSPLLVIGMGPPMESAQAVFRWQMTEREPYSLELMDADRDGRTTHAEIRANISRTPAGVNGMIEPYLLPGGWGAAEIAQLRNNQLANYEKLKAETLAHEDADPYPTVAAPFASYQWWKSWYSDDVPVAARLARWRAPLRLHYGDRDSQVHAERQKAAASSSLSPKRYSIAVHPGAGHTLGSDVLMGPLEAKIAEQIASEAASAARGCR